ncbi:SIR2 family protein [Clostridium tertium]|uniref:SIR2 family protein n=1 Tax=Clostridium tertium TaxID=1559 RepID=UPI0024B39309|nr:SIR2 family protein [Clostridium tertium]MDI9218463.1 SIR2 family protein [Clostridium tertium]
MSTYQEELNENLIPWPKSLVTEIAERRCIIFIGSGISAGCKNTSENKPKDWDSFLKSGINRLNNNETKKFALKLCSEYKYLDAAQVLHDHINNGDFEEFIQEELNPMDPYIPSEVYKIIQNLDAKIVVTTNYDTIYEKLCMQGQASAAYNVLKYYESNILNDIRSRKRLIIKAHGCVNNTDKIILTRSQYFNARDRYHSFYNILDALFLTNTILFLGCGLNDPDINLVLENSNIAAKSTRPHYALMSEGNHDSIKKAMETTYNLQILEYPNGRHDLIEDALDSLLEQVLLHREQSGMQ